MKNQTIKSSPNKSVSNSVSDPPKNTKDAKNSAKTELIKNKADKVEILKDVVGVTQ